ncbi:PAS domain-containing protein [Exiguobacterium sp. SL14]|nr:PAS domain-containing protein [Exiguobacterium sp. SL14]MCY1691049.1 PAS domain-containing protein [Exiguobacterium sp. SL14]
MQEQATHVTDTQVIRAIEQNLAIIRFDDRRKVAYVNELFARTMGYEVEELIGKYHRDLCFPAYVNSPDYELFWRKLMQGITYQDKIERRVTPMVNRSGSKRRICRFIRMTGARSSVCRKLHQTSRFANRTSYEWRLNSTKHQRS